MTVPSTTDKINPDGIVRMGHVVEDPEFGPGVAIPLWILDAPISAGAIHLYLLLVDHAGAGATTMPSRPVMADMIGCKDLKSVDRRLRELDGIGALDTIALNRWTPPPPGPRRRQAQWRIEKAFRRIGERDGFRCRVCGLDRTLTVDHVIAVANGGSDDDENLQILCRSHNSQKGTR